MLRIFRGAGLSHRFARETPERRMSPQPVDTLKGFGGTFKQIFKKPITQEYPEVKRPVYPRFRGRHRLWRVENGGGESGGGSPPAAAGPAPPIPRVAAGENPGKPPPAPARPPALLHHHH